MLRNIVIAATAAALLAGCALFQQVPGRVTNGTVTSEAGGVWGKSTPGTGCPGIEFMGAQNVGIVDAKCSGSGTDQSIHAEAVDANAVLKSAIDGQVQLGQQVVGLAQSVIAAFGAAGKVATGGLGVAAPMSPTTGMRGSMPMLVCPIGTTITLVGSRTLCL